jgi:hypothetical protein
MGNKARIVAPVKEGCAYRADAKEPKKKCKQFRRPAVSKSAVGAKGATDYKQA